MAQTAFILILTDPPQRGEPLAEALREKQGHACNVVATLDEALDSIRGRGPDVVVADALVGGQPTPQPLASLLDAVAPDATLITLDDQDRPPPAVRRVQLMHVDARDDAPRLVRTVGEAAARAVARREDRLLRESLAAQKETVFEGIVGASPQIRQIVERIRRAANNKLTVLIVGETGTGKELIAEAIHRQSDRGKKPFKPVNCAGLNENLLESELFGHVRGAFTGAVNDRKGLFQAADGGTLFLDEIGDMPPLMQSKLLRVLERREIMPVGSTDLIRVDVRVVAASNKDLREAVDRREFRADLYYRLHQWEIKVPPLRERRQDIPLLAHYLLEKANRDNGMKCPGLSSEAMSYLTRYYWPGNVRQLSNLINTLVCEVGERQVEADDLPEEIRGSREIVPVSSGGLVGLTMEQLERMAIERTLLATGGNREQAAKMLNIGTRTLYRKIKEFGL